jgi:hypothetical protein
VSPLPGTRTVHPQFAAHHQPTARSTMESPAVFRRISEGPAPYPLPDGWAGSELLWETKVRVQALIQRAASAVSADQPFTDRRYLVTCPLDGPELRAGERGDLIDVDGRTLRINSIAFGTYQFERDLICLDDITQQNPT